MTPAEVALLWRVTPQGRGRFVLLCHRRIVRFQTYARAIDTSYDVGSSCRLAKPTSAIRFERDVKVVN